MLRKIRTGALLALCMFISQVTIAHASGTYPTKPIRLVVPYAAGGDTDLIARKLGQVLTASLRQQIIIDNRPGANGIIGTELVAKAPSDGYTLLMGAASTHVINPFLYPSLRYDPIKDFLPVSGVTNIPMFLVVHPSLPVKSVQDLIALAKSKPGHLNYASAGNGSPQHLSGEMLRMAAGIDINHIPYKGGGPATIDVVAGQVEMMFAFTATALPYMKTGHLRALAATTKEPLALAPEVPSVHQVGLPQLELSSWMGVFAPAGTPPAIVKQLNAEITKAMSSPEMKDALDKVGGVLIAGTPQQFAEFIHSETDKWGKLVKDSGAKID